MQIHQLLLWQKNCETLFTISKTKPDRGGCFIFLLKIAREFVVNPIGLIGDEDETLMEVRHKTPYYHTRKEPATVNHWL